MKTVSMIISTVAMMVFLGCSGEKQENKVAAVQEPVKKEVPAPVVETKPEPAPVIKEEPAKVVQKVVEEVQKVAAVVQQTGPDGALLFRACATCHGAKAEKKALGQSQIIAGWDKQKLIDAMEGYKKGTYGGMMAMTMKPQMDQLNSEQIASLAEYIATLK